MFRRHPLLSIVTVLYLGFVGWLTLSPSLPFGDGTDGVVWRVLRALDEFPGARWLDYSDVEFAANIAMFAPIGMFFVLLFGRARWWLAMLLSVALSCAIELAQLLFFTTRVADVRDIVSNSTGAIVGAVVVLILTAGKARQLRREATARRNASVRASDRQPAYQRW
ncbi:VanZ family protein [Naasia lichenicola]|uniref:VanZ family protein n=1 Tax=Naasia lichenicola TaxID=2565933 RepID=A0A4S4FPW8_9MICO|nr:VanZ family protein [Naasia lichenicola]THG32341.1 VanZ family protein [Naasia lichenicola]